MPSVDEHENPVPGFIRGGDGKLYPRRIVAAVATIAVAGSNDAAGERAARVERAMSLAVTQALDEGIAIDSPEIGERIRAARDAAMNE